MDIPNPQQADEATAADIIGRVKKRWETEAKVETVSPGFVIVRGLLGQEEQLWFARYALSAGRDEERGHSFWVRLPTTNQLVLNSDVGRGRIYDDIDTFPSPDVIRDLCTGLVKLAQKQDPKMPDMEPTHLLLLYYATQDGMCWHSDSDKNDGDNDHPIVSITVGNSSEFGYKLACRPEEYIRLDSGDVLIWGGPNRLLPHCVRTVYPNTAPKFLPDELHNVRLNFTFRDAPNIRGREKQFKYSVENTYEQLLPHMLSAASDTNAP